MWVENSANRLFQKPDNTKDAINIVFSEVENSFMDMFHGALHVGHVKHSSKNQEPVQWHECTKKKWNQTLTVPNKKKNLFENNSILNNRIKWAAKNPVEWISSIVSIWSEFLRILKGHRI